jgi:hypothetical protein
MILRHERALARAIHRKARIWLSLTKEFATGNRTVTATNQDDGAHIVDIGKSRRTDYLSTCIEPAEVQQF